MERGRRREVVCMPHVMEPHREVPAGTLLRPTGDPRKIVSEIAGSSFVASSSLHAVIVAEAYGIPARLVGALEEPIFKYRDYYAGTGREEFEPAPSFEKAIKWGGEPPPLWNAHALLDAFPTDLWPLPILRGQS
jgi:pyruvyltransferase